MDQKLTDYSHHSFQCINKDVSSNFAVVKRFKV